MKSSLRARRMARNHRRMQQSPRLNLVSLMDIFTILVFFLMVNSGDVEVLQADKDIKLPESVSEQKPDVTLLIKISATDVIVQGRSIAKVDDILSEEGNEIAELQQELEYLAERSKPLETEEEQQKGRAVTIMGDQFVPYQLLKKVMSTCAQTDYRDIALAVNAAPAFDEDAFINSQQQSQPLASGG